MNRPSYDQLATRLKHEEEEKWRYQIALHLVMNEEPIATVHVMEPGQKGSRYSFRVYGIERADGGTVIVTHAFPGQRDSHAAYSWETFKRLATASWEVNAVARLETSIYRKRNRQLRIGIVPSDTTNPTLQQSLRAADHLK